MAASRNIAALSIKAPYMSHMILQVTICIQTAKHPQHTHGLEFLLYTRHPFCIMVVSHSPQTDV